MMELANGVRLEPGDAITKETIEHIQALLRHGPSVAHVHLQRGGREKAEVVVVDENDKEKEEEDEELVAVAAELHEKNLFRVALLVSAGRSSVPLNAAYA